MNTLPDSLLALLIWWDWCQNVWPFPILHILLPVTFPMWYNMQCIQCVCIGWPVVLSVASARYRITVSLFCIIVSNTQCHACLGWPIWCSVTSLPSLFLSAATISHSLSLFLSAATISHSLSLSLSLSVSVSPLSLPALLCSLPPPLPFLTRSLFLSLIVCLLFNYRLITESWQP